MDRRWTPELVEERLIEAFRSMPHEGIYSPRADEFQVVSGRRITGLGLLAVTSKLLVRESQERIALLTYARSKAGGASVADFCREKGWSRQTFDNRRRHAAKVVSDGINAVKSLTTPSEAA